MWERIWQRLDQVNLIRRLPLIGFSCCLATMATGTWTLWNSYSRAQIDDKERIADLGAVLAEQAAHNVQVADILLRDVQARIRNQGVIRPDQLRQMFGGAIGYQFMNLLVETLRPADGIALFGWDGMPISHAHSAEPSRIDDRAYFAWLRDHRIDELMFAGPWINRATGLMAFYAARRIESADGDFLGVAVVGMSTQYFSDLYRSVVRDKHIGISLLRDDGTLLVRYPPMPGEASGDRITVRPDCGFFDLVARGGGTVRTPGYLIDHITLMSVHPVPGYPLVVDVAMDAATALRSWLMQSSFTIVVTPTLAIAILVLFLSIARRVRSQEEHAAALADYTAALRASEERLDRAQEIAALGSWELDIETGKIHWSRNLFRIRGMDPSTDMSEAKLADILPPEETAVRQAWLAELAAGHQPGVCDLEALRPDGTVCTLRVEGRAMIDPDGGIRRLTGTTRDVTELRLLERELIQSQKMEAIGTLAGGISHDFNNLLGVIIGNLDLLRTLIENGSEAAELCDEALEGATRGADLVKRLLAFARRQPLRPEPVDVNALVTDVARLLRRALGDGVVLRTDLGGDVGSAMIDPAQLQASLVNLGTNARDAMPDGGRLHIGTDRMTVGVQDGVQHDDVAPGTYAVITVRDTGSGMESDVVKHIFEPFFTTKGPEKGTGLGLSMVLGFVSQSGGHVSVRSEPGVGSSFRLYLPRLGDGDDEAREPPPAAAISRGNVVLVVDDNARSRCASVRQISALGYRVREAADASAAMRVLERGERIDILLADLTLSGVQDGLDLAETAIVRWPALHVVLMSGWAGIRDAKNGLARWGRPVLGKPFFTDELAAALRGEAPPGMVW